MEITGRETPHQLELINAATSAVMLFMYVCRELDEAHEDQPQYAATHPEAVAACMNAAAAMHMASTTRSVGELLARNE